MAWFGSRCLYLICFLMMIQVNGGQSGIDAGGVEKVKLELYYESLCPYCANFIVNMLPVIFQNGLIDIIELKFYPWGNAKKLSDNSVACQHGPSECLLNEIDACALDVWPSLSEHFPFLYCVENLVYEHKYTEWETCFGKLGLDSKAVTDCYTTGYGRKLVLEYAAETDALQPPHRYVPWVVVDGQPLYEDYENFVSYVCKAYKGSPPSACSDLSTNGVLKRKSDLVRPICYKQETVKEQIQSSVASWIHQMLDAAAF